MRLKTRSLAAAALLLAPSFLGVRPVQAWPTRSPSARAAARLKYNPPQNWIRHYLGDDRYKISGGVWQVVSTHTDTYYHRASCPNMLRQSADIVIGFNKSKEAADDGYRADPTCQPDATAYIYDSPGGAGGGPSANGTFTNRSNRSQMIVLADGKSTVGLPPGWTRVLGLKTTAKEGFFAIDMLVPPSRKGQVGIVTMSMPGIIQGANLTDVRKTKANMQLFKSYSQRSGVVNNNLSDLEGMMDRVTVRPARVGNMPGVVMTAPRIRNSRYGNMGTSWYTGRGDTMYMITDMSNNAKGLSSIISSYRPR